MYCCYIALLNLVILIICECVLLLVGSGVDIYVFAEGINLDHDEFEGRAFNGGYGQSQDCFSKLYGTHVASLAAGRSVGVATKANVYRYVHFHPYFHAQKIQCSKCNFEKK